MGPEQNMFFRKNITANLRTREAVKNDFVQKTTHNWFAKILIRSTRFDFSYCVRASFFAPVFRDFWELGIVAGGENFGEFELQNVLRNARFQCKKLKIEWEKSKKLPAEPCNLHSICT